MNKSHIFCIMVGLCGIWISFSQEQEFIKKPKEKKICPSRQQHIELDACIVDMTNNLLQVVVSLQKHALDEINGYMSNHKECFLNNATKKKRAEMYQVKEQLKAEMPKMIEVLQGWKEKITRSMVAF